MKDKPNPLDKFNDTTLKKAKKYAFLPSGIFGAHNFLLGRWLIGLLHMAWIIPLAFYNPIAEGICKNIGGCQTVVQTNQFYTIAISLFVVLVFISYLWSIIEGKKIADAIYKRTPEYRQMKEEEKRTTLSPTKEDLKKIDDKADVYGTLSLISMIIVIVVIILLVAPLINFLIVPSAAFSQGAGDIGLIFVPLAIVLLIIFLPLAIVFSEAAKKARKKVETVKKEEGGPSNEDE